MKRDDQILSLIERLLEEKINTVNVRIAGMEIKMDELTYVIKGNGKKGLVDEINDIKSYIGNLKVYGSIAVMILSFGIALLKDYITRQFK